MKIKTLMVVCLLAFSPLAMAAKAPCECSKHGPDKHHMDMGAMKMSDHAAMDKVCTDDCCKMHDKTHVKPMEMSSAEHAAMPGMDMSSMDHATDKTCATGDCADMCGDECADCCDDGCDCCDHMEHAAS